MSGLGSTGPGPRARGGGLRLALLLGPLLLDPACGYRPLPDRLPGQVRTVRVPLCEVALGHEPALGPLLSESLVRHLGRLGVQTSAVGRADACLRCRVLKVSRSNPVIDVNARRLAAQDLELELELHLVGSAGQTLWRSGLMHIQRLWPLPQNPLSAETLLQSVLAELADEAAREGVLLLGASP